MIMEGSLSDFGDSDAILIADNNNEKKVFFFEAKVSNGNSYKLQQQFEKFKSKKSYNGYSSNLFYQLSLKYYLFNMLKWGESNVSEYIKSKGTTSKNPRTVETRNEIVQKIYNLIKSCSKAEYIAITPDPTIKGKLIKDLNKDVDIKLFSSQLHFVTWDQIINKFDNLKPTHTFNCSDKKDLILNK